MDSKSLWNDQIPDRDGIKTPINDIAISPDGTKVIAAAGNRVLLYKADTGDLIESLRGHKDVVYSVSFCFDGSRFSSGGADNVVVIWKSSGQGLLKYNHSAPIQRVAYNPQMMILASCSDVDFGFWTPDQKQVAKEKVSSRITTVAWSADGTMLAIGLLSGVISIRNQQAEEILKIERKSPIWSLVFIPDTSPPSTKSSSNNAGTGKNITTTTFPSNTGVASVENKDLLVVGCWDRTYSLYKMQSNISKLMSEKSLKYYPCSIVFAGNQLTKTTYLVIAGSNRKVTLYSRDGAKLSEVCMKDSWIWCCGCHGDSDLLALGSHSGNIEMMKLKFESVHSLYRDRYAYRENLTEVIVHHLVTEKRVRIKCKDLIRNLSLYKNKLAVQLSDRVCIYESNPDDTGDMHFRLSSKGKIMLKDTREESHLNTTNKNIGIKNEFNLMTITSANLIFTTGNFVELYTFDGQRQKVWELESPARCMCNDGGPEGHEGIILGLASGAIIKIFIDNPFPLELTKRQLGVIQLDINIFRSIIASVDINYVLNITDLHSQEILFTAQNIMSVSFNTEVEDLICITGIDSSISVISGAKSASTSFEDSFSGGKKANHHIEIQEQHIAGIALGFRGQKIFCLHRGVISPVDVPQGVNMQRALDNDDILTAYKIACLGVTEADWKLLAMRSLRANYINIAKNAFSRLKDTRFLSLIDAIERRGSSSIPIVDVKSANLSSGRNRTNTVTNSLSSQPFLASTKIVPPLEPQWVAELLAYEGHHQEAAKVYARAGKLDQAIRLFTDLRRWDDAKVFSRNSGISDVGDLSIQQAKWLQEINDWKGASELFISMGQYMTAAKIIGDSSEEGWEDVLLEVVRACPVDDFETLNYCGELYSNLNDTQYAKETFTKSKDISKLMTLYAKRQQWNEAAKLADEHEGKFDVSVFLPYAEWLVSQDRYEEAMQAFKKSQRSDLSRKVLEELTNNAVAESRFKDAAYYFWMLSKETELEILKDSSKIKTSSHEQLQFEYELKADLYFAYASVHAYVTDPFTSQQPEMLFQVSRFIINSLGNSETIPLGISKASTFYTLARQAMLLGAFKLARHAYDRLSKLQLTDRRLEEVEIDMLLVQAKPVRDDPDHLPVCYRCGSVNPLLNPFTNKFSKGDVCTNCGHPFVRSFINFDILPLVEFVPEPSISDEEAIELIRQPPVVDVSKYPFGTIKQATTTTSVTKGGRGGWKESKSTGKKGEADMMTFDNNNSDSKGDDSDDIREDILNEAMGINSQESDLFTRCLNLTVERQKGTYTPVKVDANTLLSINRLEVFVCRPSSKSKRATFYRNMLPELPVAISQPCHRFFHLEDFEFAYLSNKKCPYSRLKNVGEYGSL